MLTITFHSRVLPAYLCVFVGTRRTFSVLGNQELCQHTFSVLGNQELCLFSRVSPHSSLSLCVCWDSSHVFCPREPRTMPTLVFCPREPRTMPLLLGFASFQPISVCLLGFNTRFLSSGTKNYASSTGFRLLPAYLCIYWDSTHVFCHREPRTMPAHVFCPREPRTMPTHVFCPREPRTMPTHVFCPREPRTVPLLLGFVSCEKPGVSQGVLWGLLTLAALALLPRLNQPRPRTSVGRQEVTSLVVALTPPRLCPPSPFVSPEALGCLM